MAGHTVLHEKEKLSQSGDGVSGAIRQANRRSSAGSGSELSCEWTAAPHEEDLRHQESELAARNKCDRQENTARSDF